MDRVEKMVRIALRETFRYINEPLHVDEDALALLGNAEIIEEIRSRIAHSRGGAFLVAGFRGVGKSTLVLRALEQMRRESDPGTAVLPVVLSVARSTTTDRLLFALVRRIFETLNDSAVFSHLSPKTQQSLLLAYMRTSLSFKETQTKATEKGGSIELGGAAGKSVASVAVPKVNLSAKRTRSLATEASFLAYSETDVEHDLMRIISLLNADSALSRGSRSWLRRLWARRRHRSSRLHLVIVLDEVDKLTTGESGVAAIEELLSGLKNVLTMVGAHFLLIAGPDLHDRAMKDASRGNSVYESVFSWLTYVPCTWEAPERLLDAVVSETAEEKPVGEIALLANYLKFKARGVPRRLLQEFNAFMTWDGNQPFLCVDETERRRLEFYARLEEILADYFVSDRHEQLFPASLDQDRRRLGAYYTVDWIVRSAGDPFTATDLVREGEDAELDPLLQLSQRVVERLLGHLVKYQVVEIVRSQDFSAVVIGDVAEAQLTVYKLADNATRALLGFAIHNESERAVLEGSRLTFRHMDVSEVSVAEESVLGIRTLGSRYELRSLLGQGGMGTVYRGRDLGTGLEVAIKVLRPAMAMNEQAVARFRRESAIASTIKYPQIVQTYDVVADSPDGLALVMELLPGRTLRAEVDAEGPLGAVAAAKLGLALAGALNYLENRGLVRIDLKPSNVMMHPDRGPVIIDLGLAREVETAGTRLTFTGGIVGTPIYMAPEQLNDLPVDVRADIYSLGLLLYFSLAGRVPWEGDRMVTIFARILNDDIDVDKLPVSPEFRAVIKQATDRDREKRFAHAVDLKSALEAVPELASS
ncbi:serine/threonine-protein kinase [Amycolatopsis eburnea]|uniref:non-specific serine/threonine protein kinase n=1 Tax=Amycolatopsis eburnea TaxID=2267691 RepID=A0A3R9DRH8_9PSEU|nr:serine/threonine-protein kinase [Amycolatopsis eburnea]RSD10274.1 hypothetical protein EIY87_35905 [Amycolatopsis eburnea]